MSEATPAVLVLWEDIVDMLLEKTSAFPKTWRMSLSARIEGLALDTYECLIEARYSKSPTEILKRVNLNLEKLRMLLRVSFRRKILATKGLRSLIEKIDEAGKMVGGWAKHAESKASRT